MLGFKYRNHRALAVLFADRLVAVLRTSIEIESIDVLTWVPTTRERRTARGHDQAETLARFMGRSLGVPVRKLLVRETFGHQTGQSRESRLVGVSLRARSLNTPTTILVVDDVVTTGATLEQCYRALVQIKNVQLSVAALAIPVHNRLVI